MPVIITKVRHSFLKENIFKINWFIKKNDNNNSQALVHIRGKQLHQLMKITEQETIILQVILERLLQK